MKPQALIALVSCLYCSCATGTLDLADAAQARAEAPRLAEGLAENDVVFLGEVHDSDAGHALQLRVLEELCARRPSVVVSMEMFERDVQGKLDEYLSGKCSEAEMLAATRPWGNYARHYRPIVELCKQRGMRVVAANVPRPLAAQVSREGVAAAAKNPHAAASTSAPRDAYWDEFKRAMTEDSHGAAMPEERMLALYAAQCLKDDTMAESIARALDAAPGAMVVHLCGSFHSHKRLGTVARLQARKPSLAIGVVSMHAPEKGKPGPTSADVASVDRLVIVHDSKPEDPKRAANPHAASAPSPTGRPGLGLMPDYASGGMGMAIENVREGGPAAEAGLRAGDVITRLGGEEVKDAQSYMQALERLTIGKLVEVEVLREGKVQRLSVKVGVSMR